MIHACIQTGLPVAGKSVGRQGNDCWLGNGQAADLPCGRNAVQLGHRHVHQDDIRLQFLEHFHCRTAIAGFSQLNRLSAEEFAD